MVVPARDAPIRFLTLPAWLQAANHCGFALEPILEQVGILAEADPQARALFTWYSIEEIEHKAVAFDVMQRVAKISYAMRALFMAEIAVMFTVQIFRFTDAMLVRDGFGFWQRAGLWMRGLAWLFGRPGLLGGRWGAFFAYFKPSFYPWQHATSDSHTRWVASFAEASDPLAATDALHALAR